MQSTMAVVSMIAIAGTIVGLGLAFWWRFTPFVRRSIPGEVVPELNIRDNPDGTFSVVDTSTGGRVVTTDFVTRSEAEQFVEQYDLDGRDGYTRSS